MVPQRRLRPDVPLAFRIRLGTRSMVALYPSHRPPQKMLWGALGVMRRKSPEDAGGFSFAVPALAGGAKDE